MLQFHTPIPVVTEHGDGYAIYVESGGPFENDCFTVVLCDGGVVRHYLSHQIKIFANSTYEINKNEESII